MSTVLSPIAVEYPSSDGKPVAESDFQLLQPSTLTAPGGSFL